MNRADGLSASGIAGWTGGRSLFRFFLLELARTGNSKQAGKKFLRHHKFREFAERKSAVSILVCFWLSRYRERASLLLLLGAIRWIFDGDLLLCKVGFVTTVQLCYKSDWVTMALLPYPLLPASRWWTFSRKVKLMPAGFLGSMATWTFGSQSTIHGGFDYAQ